VELWAARPSNVLRAYEGAAKDCQSGCVEEALERFQLRAAQADEQRAASPSRGEPDIADKDPAAVFRCERSMPHLADRSFAFSGQVDAQLTALTLEQVNAALRKYVDPAKFVVGVAGDFKESATYPRPAFQWLAADRAPSQVSAIITTLRYAGRAANMSNQRCR
jgi:hypothetical protein